METILEAIILFESCYISTCAWQCNWRHSLHLLHVLIRYVHVTCVGIMCVQHVVSFSCVAWWIVGSVFCRAVNVTLCQFKSLRLLYCCSDGPCGICEVTLRSTLSLCLPKTPAVDMNELIYSSFIHAGGIDSLPTQACVGIIKVLVEKHSRTVIAG